MLPSTTHDVARFTLDNGLTVLIKENHSAAVTAAVAHVTVGYFDEPDRWNGLSHVIEHMFFKGTSTRPGKEQIAQEVRAIGGHINAGTYYDETSYYIVAPSAHIEKAIELQADTFLHSHFDSEELAKEIEVIIQESKQKRDNPGAMLIETLYARAFDQHRIRRWRIGPDEVLRALRREDLVAFVEQTYRPENIVLSIVGDVQTDAVLEAVRRQWEPMPRGELRKDPSPPEPEHRSFRFHRMRGAIQQRLLDVGYKAPPVLHPDAPALMVLGALLSDGRSARLYRALKEERQLVNAVWAGYEGFADLGLFTMGAESVADDPLASEQALFAEVGRLLREPAGPEELQRVKTRIESRRLFSQEEVLGMARSLAYYQALGDYHLADAMLARLEAVTADDVERVAREYLAPERATLVEYLPQDADVPERNAATTYGTLQSAVTAGSDSSARERAEIGAARAVGSADAAEIQVGALPNGSTLLFRSRRDLPVVAIQILLPGGKRGESRDNAGITSLMLKAAIKGTRSFSATEIAGRIESLGTGIGLPLTPDYFGFSLKLLADRVSEGLEILREVICDPTFPAEEVEKEKQSIYGEIRRQQDSMSSRAIDLFNAACFGDQPYGLPSSGIADAVAALTPDDLRAWHARWVRGGGAAIGVVGDIDWKRLQDLLAECVPPGDLDVTDRAPICALPPGERIVDIARQQTASVMGFPGATFYEEERHALDVIAEITSGLAGRFFQAVRGDNALAYAVTSFHRSRRDAGNFVTYTATSPGREVEARDILLRECRRLAKEPVQQAELADAKQAIRGEHVIGLQTFSAQAAEMTLARIHQQPLDATQRYLARIESVTPEEIQSVAARYLDPDHIWLGVVRGSE